MIESIGTKDRNVNIRRRAAESRLAQASAPLQPPGGEPVSASASGIKGTGPAQAQRQRIVITSRYLRRLAGDHRRHAGQSSGRRDDCGPGKAACLDNETPDETKFTHFRRSHPARCFLLTARRPDPDYTRWVNPFIGTGGHGHTFPGATMPFGMVQLSPDTRADNWDGSSGYHYSDDIIYGFSHTHLSGTGIPDGCDILFMPTTR